MKNCTDFIEAVNLYSDGLLSHEENLELEAHIASCPDCARRVEAARAISGAFAYMEEAPPDTLAPGIRYKLQLEPMTPPRWKRLVPGWATLAAAAVAIFIIFGQPKTARQDGEATYGMGGYLSDANMEADKGVEEETHFFGTESAGLLEDEDSAPAPTPAPSSVSSSVPSPAQPPAPGMAGEAKLENGSDGGGALPEDFELPDEEKPMGIMLIDGESPSDLEDFRAIEYDGYDLVVVPKEKFVAFSQSNEGVVIEEGDYIDAESTTGMVVFFK